MIQTLEEFGPSYFQLAELTRITPEEFRAISPVVKNQVLHIEDEAIALLPENAGKLTAAVEKLRRTAHPRTARPPSSPDLLVRLEHRCDEVVAGFQKLSSRQSQAVNQSLLSAVLEKTITALRRVHLTTCLTPLSPGS